MAKTYYRIKDAYDESGLYIILQQYSEIRATPQGSWIVPKGLERYADEFEYAKRQKIAIWTPHFGRKFAPTLELAKRSYYLRKHRQTFHAEIALKSAQSAIDARDKIDAMTLDDLQHNVWIGKPDFINRIQFDY